MKGREFKTIPGFKAICREVVRVGGEIKRLLKPWHVLQRSIASKGSSVVRALNRFLIRVLMAQNHSTMRANVRKKMDPLVGFGANQRLIQN
jgi:hypothetical protein